MWLTMRIGRFETILATLGAYLPTAWQRQCTLYTHFVPGQFFFFLLWVAVCERVLRVASFFFFFSSCMYVKAHFFTTENH
jgi:hypothetical protein